MPPMNQPPARMLIIQPGALGDSIITLPLIRLLRRQWREDQDIACDMMGHRENLNFLQGRSDIDQIISMESMSLHRLFVPSGSLELDDKDPLMLLLNRYDLILTFLNDPDGHFERNLVRTTIKNKTVDVVSLRLSPPKDYPEHVSQYMIQQFSDEMPHSRLSADYNITAIPYITPLPLDQEMGRQILRQNGVDPGQSIVIIHPGSGSYDKCWPLENFQKLSQNLTNSGMSSLFLLGPAEIQRGFAKPLNGNSLQILLKNLTVDEVVAVLSCAAACVGNDSGISHLAGAMNLPTYAVFGPTNPVNWSPLGGKKRIFSPKNEEKWPVFEEIWPVLSNEFSKISQKNS